MGIKRAKMKEVRQLVPASLGADVPAVAVLEQITLPKKQKSTQMLSGSPKEAAAALVEKLRLEVHVL
jgi:electron transfer flavoprotein beta subunit